VLKRLRRYIWNYLELALITGLPEFPWLRMKGACLGFILPVTLLGTIKLGRRRVAASSCPVHNLYPKRIRANSLLVCFFLMRKSIHKFHQTEVFS